MWRDVNATQAEKNLTTLLRCRVAVLVLFWEKRWQLQSAFSEEWTWFLAGVCPCDSRRLWQSKRPFLKLYFQVFVDQHGHVAGDSMTHNRRSSRGSFYWKPWRRRKERIKENWSVIIFLPRLCNLPKILFNPSRILSYPKVNGHPKVATIRTMSLRSLGLLIPKVKGAATSVTLR